MARRAATLRAMRCRHDAAFGSRPTFPAFAAAIPLALSRNEAHATTPPPDDLVLMAHRGGIVDASHPENSPSSAEAAIERGFRMLEVDIRRSRDGVPVVQHDAAFTRFYGVDRAVDELTWTEIETLGATPGGSRPMTFDGCACGVAAALA